MEMEAHRHHQQSRGRAEGLFGMASQSAIMTTTVPRSVKSWVRPLHLYHNNGDGTFTDVTDSAGMKNSGRGPRVRLVDTNNDGRLDIIIALCRLVS